MGKYIAYYRVSTTKQGQSGLGLEAQQAAVMNFIKDAALIAEYTEIESGKKSNRTVLAKAIDHAKKEGATLVIAKLDRLSRDVEFIFKLRNTGIDFICCDMPEANTLTIGIMAVMVQAERERISQRTKDALKALKARGVKLGKPENLTQQAREKGVKALKEKAAQANRQIKAQAAALRKEGKTLQAIVGELSELGYRSRKGKALKRTTIKRLLD